LDTEYALALTPLTLSSSLNAKGLSWAKVSLYIRELHHQLASMSNIMPTSSMHPKYGSVLLAR
jgi:hypothetical protein